MRILAHAFGARYELPIPLYLFVIGGGLVVVASFLLVIRASTGTHERPPADTDDGAHLSRVRPIAGFVSIAWLAFLCWCGFAGSQEVSENLIATVFWVVVWVAVPLSCALIGDWTQPVNPFAVLAKLADQPRLRAGLLGGHEPLPWPGWLGWWPAVGLFFATACLELIFNLYATQPHVTAALLAAYAALSTVAGLFFGPEWLRRGEMFTVLFDTWGRLGWFRFGAPGRRGFAGGLDHPFARRASRVAFVMLLLLNVNFDGLLSTPRWTQVHRSLPSQWQQPLSHLHLFDTGSFLAMAFALAIVFTVFAHATARAGQHPTTPLQSVSGVIPSLLPIAFGYLLSHYVEYLVVNLQLLIPIAGNPAGLASWPIHLPYPFNDSYEVHTRLLPSAFYWYLSLAVIVAVHVYAVVLAHRHLIRVGRTPALQRRSEYPWLIAMVAYTCLSLWLIAQPLTQEGSTTSDTSAATTVPSFRGGGTA